MRVSLATGLTALFALALLVLPRSILGPGLALLRPAIPPAVPASSSSTEAAYPPALFSDVGSGRVAAPVFALGAGPYRQDLRIARGSDDGIGEGMAAILPGPGTPPVLVGRVSEASASGATLQTLSDPAWKTAVRIGSSSVDALLIGGLVPTLSLIAKGAPLAEGDAVVSADPSLPYGLALGTVADLRDTEGGVLREATLALPYAASGLRALEIVTGDAR